MHKMVKVKFDNFLAPDLAKNVFRKLGAGQDSERAVCKVGQSLKQRNKETKTEGKFWGLKPNFLVKVSFRCVKILPENVEPIKLGKSVVSRDF